MTPKNEVMIKFFRNIRKMLLSDPPERAGSVRAGGKTTKYLKYTIGEILLVMVGILLALQVNNWNELRKGKKQEKELLLTVLENIKTDSLTIDQIQKRKKEITAVHQQLIQFNKGDIPESSVGNVDYVRRSFATGIVTQSNNPNLPNRVLNIDVKKAVLNYYLTINNAEFGFSEYRVIIENNVRPFLGERSLLNYGNQFRSNRTDSIRFVNREKFLQEFEDDALKQVLFEAGLKLKNLDNWMDELEKANEELKMAIKNYLSKS